MPSGPPFDIIIDGGKILDIHPANPSNRCDAGDVKSLIAAGFIDIQINGYGGIDFNDPEARIEDIAGIAAKLWHTGVTSFLPTVITESSDHINKCLANLIKASEQSTEFERGMIGIHLEGPFISPEDGPRGAHPKAHTRPPDWDQFQRWQDTSRGEIRIVTLSPEWPQSIGFIERAIEAGIIAAIGHTAASPAQINDAVRAGAKLSTHLGNGSHAKIDRHPNYIWEQLAADQLWASFIVDGHHLPPSVVKSFLRCKTISRSILVTDAIAAAGMPAGRYRLGNVEVEVTDERKVCLPRTPYLAGSALEMQDAISKTVQFSDATLEDALTMASENPAKLLGIGEEKGKVEVGKRADLVLFNWDDERSELEVEEVAVNGEVVFQK